jgi:hypothetical protein
VCFRGQSGFLLMTSAVSEKTSLTISKKEKRLLVLLLVLLVLAFHQLVIGEEVAHFMPTVVGAFFSVSGMSPQFLYVLVIGLFIIRRKDIARAYHGKGEPWSAMLFLVPGVCLFLWGHFVGVMDIIHVSFILVGFGAARFLSGKRLTRSILPPVLILVLATPLPAVLINQMMFPMQLWDTEHSVWLLNAVGIPSLAKGDMISMAEHSTRFAEVADNICPCLCVHLSYYPLARGPAGAVCALDRLCSQYPQSLHPGAQPRAGSANPSYLAGRCLLHDWLFPVVCS